MKNNNSQSSGELDDNISKACTHLVDSNVDELKLLSRYTFIRKEPINKDSLKSPSNYLQNKHLDLDDELSKRKDWDELLLILLCHTYIETVITRILGLYYYTLEPIILSLEKGFDEEFDDFVMTQVSALEKINEYQLDKLFGRLSFKDKVELFKETIIPLLVQKEEFDFDLAKKNEKQIKELWTNALDPLIRCINETRNKAAHLNEIGYVKYRGGDITDPKTKERFTNEARAVFYYLKFLLGNIEELKTIHHLITANLKDAETDDGEDFWAPVDY